MAVKLVVVVLLSLLVISSGSSDSDNTPDRSRVGLSETTLSSKQSDADIAPVNESPVLMDARAANSTQAPPKKKGQKKPYQWLHYGPTEAQAETFNKALETVWNSLKSVFGDEGVNPLA